MPELIDTGSQNVTGYRKQTPEALATINEIKALEVEVAQQWLAVKRRIDLNANPRLLAVARTHFETAFMYLNRAVFQPVDPFDGDTT